MRCIATLLLFALALPIQAETVEGLWIKGFQGVPWGASLARTKSIHPGGVTCPQMEDGTRVYNIVLGQDPLGMKIAKVLVAFIFTRDDQLRGILVRYPYGARDDVLYRVAELLGQNYDSVENRGSTYHLWNTHGELNATFRVLDRPVQRAYFHIAADRFIERQLRARL